MSGKLRCEDEIYLRNLSHLCASLWRPQVDKLEEAESQRQTEEEVTEPQPMVFGRLSCSVDGMKLKKKKKQSSETKCFSCP